MTGPPRFRYPRGALGLTDEESIGPHRIRVVGDTVLTRYIRVPELAHVQAIHQRFDRVIAEHGRLYVVNDMSRSGIPSSETRRWIAEWARRHPIGGLVNFGASMAVRMLQSLILRASALLGSPAAIHPVHVDGEVEAFAWIEAHRGRMG